MNRQAVLDLYNQQVRRDPRPADPGAIVERAPHLTRMLCESGWAGVCWSELDGRDVDEVIAAEIRRFADWPGQWEWKDYSYDRPAELPERLLAAGFEQGEPETVLVAEIEALRIEQELPASVEFELISDQPGVDALIGMLDEVFGRAIPGMAQAMLAGITADPPRTVAMSAMFEGVPIAGGRVELEPGSDFIGLWGGATVPQWRGQGIFRALLGRATALSRELGYPYAQLDAAPMSRPILERLGFIELATTTPYTYPAPSLRQPPPTSPRPGRAGS
jgi:GNAT superfamily N-acetyltransferase